MKIIFLIALNTVKEIRRHRVLYALGVVVFFILSAGIILGPLSLSEQARLSINFTFVACHLSLLLMAVYFGSMLISHEIEKKTIIPLFVKPLDRFQFILGKFAGLAFVLWLTTLFLTLLVGVVHFIYSHPIGPILFIAMWGCFLESLILLTVAFLFSSFAGSFLVLVYSFFIFIIGHSANGIIFFLDKIQDEGFTKHLVSVVIWGLPNFEKLNWRVQALYQNSIAPGELIFSSLYACSWVTFLLIITGMLFQRKQVV